MKAVKGGKKEGPNKPRDPNLLRVIQRRDAQGKNESKKPNEKYSDDQPGYLNRSAVVVKPKQSFINFINSNHPTPLFPFEKESHVYLIDDGIDSDKMQDWLAQNFDRISMQELHEFHVEEKNIPANRTYRMFKEWFDVKFLGTPHDLESAPIHKTRPEEVF